MRSMLPHTHKRKSMKQCKLAREESVGESVSHSVVSNSLKPHGLLPTRLLCPWDFPGKNTEVGCHFLLQGIFPTQGSNPGLQTRVSCIACGFFTI